MWSGKKFRAAVVVTALTLPLLGGCGFEPMYAETAQRQQVSDAFADIEIANIPDRDGQYLRNELIDRLYTEGRPADAKYRLDVAPLKKDLYRQGITKDATYTRERMEISTTIKLVEKSTGKVVMERTPRAVGSYNLLDNQFGTLVSRDSLTNHLLAELGDSIQTSVSLYFRRAGE